MFRLRDPLIISLRPDSHFASFANSSPHGFRLCGERWPTVEHFLLAQRFAGEPLAAQIRQAPTVGAATLLVAAELRRRTLGMQPLPEGDPDPDAPLGPGNDFAQNDFAQNDFAQTHPAQNDPAENAPGEDDLTPFTGEDDLTPFTGEDDLTPFTGEDDPNPFIGEDDLTPITGDAYAGINSADQVRRDWLEKALLAKFRAHPTLAALLLETGRRTLLEEPPRALPENGGPVMSLNHQGLALMRVRTTLRRSAAQKRRPV